MESRVVFITNCLLNVLCCGHKLVVLVSIYMSKAITISQQISDC